MLGTRIPTNLTAGALQVMKNSFVHPPRPFFTLSGWPSGSISPLSWETVSERGRQKRGGEGSKVTTTWPGSWLF